MAMPELSSMAFRYFFSINIEDITDIFFSTLPHPAHPTWLSNKSQHTAGWHNWRQETTTKIFDLVVRGSHLLTPPCDFQSDMEDEEQQQQQENNILQGNNIDEILTNVWHQFLLDITMKVLNMKHVANPSHCILTQCEHMIINEGTYQNPNLAAYFCNCQWKIAEPKEWNRTFNHLIPDWEFSLAGKAQNYSTMLYYNSWNVFKGRVNKETFLVAHKVLKKWFNQLFWMAAAKSDCV